MTESMVDKIAKASFTYNWHTRKGGVGIHRTDDWNGKAIKVFELESDARDECARMNARAALKALREPTDEMIIAIQENGAVEDKSVIKSDWQAGIDAALDEKEG